MKAVLSSHFQTRETSISSATKNIENLSYTSPQYLRKLFFNYHCLFRFSHFRVDRLQDADLGFVLIIDRRTDKWSSVKTVLLKVSVSFR